MRLKIEGELPLTKGDEEMFKYYTHEIMGDDPGISREQAEADAYREVAHDVLRRDGFTVLKATPVE